MDIMNVSPNILAKKENFKNLRHNFADKKELITTTLTYSCHSNSTILLTKEKTWKNIFNTNSELSQNCTEKQIV